MYVTRQFVRIAQNNGIKMLLNEVDNEMTENGDFQ